jgi:hypothetical protein
VQVREADVVADRQADADVIEGRRDGSVPRRRVLALTQPRAAWQVDVEEVHLAVARGDLTLGIQDERGVVGPVRITRGFGYAPHHEPAPDLARQRRQRVDPRTAGGEGAREREPSFDGAHVQGVLRQRDDSGALCGGPANLTAQLDQVRLDVGAHVELDCGDLHDTRVPESRSA